jgi:hypothetical protein
MNSFASRVPVCRQEASTIPDMVHTIAVAPEDPAWDRFFDVGVVE